MLYKVLNFVNYYRAKLFDVLAARKAARRHSDG
jgi:hypothetical protein